MGNQKKNILHLCLSPAGGGLELYCLRLNEFFKKDGFESFIGCRTDSFIQKKASEQGREVITLDGRDYFSKSNVKKLSQFIRDRQIEVIFVHRLKELWLTHAISKKIPHIKVIGFAQMFIDTPKKGFFHKMIYNHLHSLIVLTDIQKNHLQNMLPLPTSKYVVIPNGIEGDKFIPQDQDNPDRLKLRKDLGIQKEEDILVGLIGRFDRQKGQIEFVEAIKNLRLRYPNVKSVLVGEDTFGEEPLQKKILEDILKNDLQAHIQVRGFSNNVSNIMNALDIFIMPSYKETFGIVLVEAMACEKICISTKAGGPPEILGEGEYGLLIEPKSSLAIEKGIEEVLNHRKKYEDKAKKARKRVLGKYQLKDVFSSIKELTLN